MGQTFTAETQRRGENVFKSDYRKDRWCGGNSSPPPLTPPTRGGGKTYPPPRRGRSGGGAELLRNLKTHTQEGFSLIEIIIVMVIIGALAGTAIPVYIGMGPSIRLSGATRQIMGDLMWARMQAISQNNEYKVFFLDDHRYQILDDTDRNS